MEDSGIQVCSFPCVVLAPPGWASGQFTLRSSPDSNCYKANILLGRVMEKCRFGLVVNSLNFVFMVIDQTFPLVSLSMKWSG